MHNCKSVTVEPGSPVDGLRRSHRTKVKALEWYKNERIKYKLRKSGMIPIAKGLLVYLTDVIFLHLK